MRPSDFCRGILASLDAAEGRRRRRRRDTTPDAAGLAVERSLLMKAIFDDPAPEAFEAWLFRCVQSAGPGSGPVHVTALRLFEEWRLAGDCPQFRDWLEHGAQSDDATA